MFFYRKRKPLLVILEPHAERFFPYFILHTSTQACIHRRRGRNHGTVNKQTDVGNDGITHLVDVGNPEVGKSV